MHAKLQRVQALGFSVRYDRGTGLCVGLASLGCNASVLQSLLQGRRHGQAREAREGEESCLTQVPTPSKGLLRLLGESFFGALSPVRVLLARSDDV